MDRRPTILLIAVCITVCSSICCPLMVMAQQGAGNGIAIVKATPKIAKQRLESKEKNMTPARNIDSLLKVQLPAYRMPRFSKPWIGLYGGRMDYTYYYRSNTDTPFIQQGAYQHQINASVGLMVGNVLPLRTNIQIRRSNSPLFRNITDVQLVLDVPLLQQQTYKGLLDHIAGTAYQLRDSVTEALSSLKQREYKLELDEFQNRFSAQRLIEANEMLQVPQITWDKSLPDSLAKIKSDSLINVAKLFIEQYDSAKAKLATVKGTADSLKAVFDKSMALVNRVKVLAQGNLSPHEMLRQIDAANGLKAKAKSLLPSHLRWLMAIRTLSIGRSPVNYSDLTVRNVMLNGLNVAYNSWYYVSVSAGLINYRFRDFVINNASRPKQYFYMGRLGIGKLEKDYFIISVYHGRKQVFASGMVNDLYPVTTTGISAESRWQFSKHSYIKAEVATSVAPDFSKVPVENNKLRFAGKQDKAMSLNARLVWPKLRTKLDLFYRYTGANFQSFSTFQNNSSIVAWGIKAEQQLFNNALKITASVKTNDFSNPYLLQRYRSNMVFKTVQLAFRKKRWPAVTIGLMPLTQLTNIDGVIYENQFHSLNASLYHYYKLAGIKGATAVVFTQFKNNAADTGLLYFNAKNVFASQVFYFSRFTASVTVTHSTNKNYELNVLGESIEIPVGKRASVTFGFKINHLNYQKARTGTFGSIRLQLMRKAALSMLFEDGYMPGLNGSLIKNAIGNIQLSTTF